jgi:hypothetical protein
MATPARPSRRGLLLGGAAGSAGLAGLALGARGLFNPPATGHEYGTPNIIQVGSHDDNIGHLDIPERQSAGTSPDRRHQDRQRLPQPSAIRPNSPPRAGL